jgi:predicted thioesterase
VLESYEGRFYVLRVTAGDDNQEIGRGTVGRAIVSTSKFVEKMKEK